MADILSKKVFAIGLPRCGGQTLQMALAYLFRRCVHSPGCDWRILDGNIAFTEVYLHPDTLIERYGAENCVFLLNVRPMDSWLESCRAVYHKSTLWNHPIWRYPLEGFCRFRQRYLDARTGCGASVIHLVEHPEWDELCSALGVPVPDVGFPRVDRHRKCLGPS